MMKPVLWSLSVSALLLAPAGCDALAGILLPTRVTVSLVNASDFGVEVEAYISDEQVLPGFLLTEVGDRLQYTIPAGESVTIMRSCDELQAIVIDDANLLIIGGAGPEASSDVLRDGDDFSCGDRITFTFSHSAAILDFDITTTVD